MWAQIENLDDIQSKRKLLWETYYQGIRSLSCEEITLPTLPVYATNNAHMFYVVLENIEQRSKLITVLKEKGFHAVFHYLSLHSSEFYKNKHDGRALSNSDKFTDCLLRMPLYYELDFKDIENIISVVTSFNKN